MSGMILQDYIGSGRDDTTRETISQDTSLVQDYGIMLAHTNKSKKTNDRVRRLKVAFFTFAVIGIVSIIAASKK